MGLNRRAGLYGLPVFLFHQTTIILGLLLLLIFTTFIRHVANEDRRRFGRAQRTCFSETFIAHCVCDIAIRYRNNLQNKFCVCCVFVWYGYAKRFL